MIAEVIAIADVIPKKKKVIKSKYPIHKKTLRPFRIWNAKERKQLQWRNYAYSWSAIGGAWAEIQWMKANTSLEVFDTATGKHIATFTKQPGGHFSRWVKPDFNFKHVEGK